MPLQRSTLVRISSGLMAGLCIIAFPLRPTAQGENVITVGSTVWVSAARPADPHSESYIAADPNDAKRLLACVIVDNAHDFPDMPHDASITVTYASFDGGRSWKPTLTVHSESYTWDPGCTYGADGVAYSISERIRPDGHAEVELDHSMDGGRTWSVQAKLRHEERAQIVTDQRRSGDPHTLYIYGESAVGANAGNGSGIESFSSGDSGRTFVQNDLLPDRGDAMWGEAPGALLRDGRLIASVASAPTAGDSGSPTIIGRHFSPQFVRVFILRDSHSAVASSLESHLVANRTVIQPSYTNAQLPSIAVDSSNGPFQDRVYVVWNDWQEGRANILLSYSSDEGVTWSPPITVNDDMPRSPRSHGPDDFMPVVAVNKRGVVGVAWYDRRDFRDNQGWSERFAASLDGGETFTPSYSVSNASADASRARHPWIVPIGAWNGGKASTFPQDVELDINSGTFNAGDTAGLTADAAGVFHPLWIGNPTGTAQLYTTTVSVNGQAVVNGSPTFAKLRNANTSIVLDFHQESYDRSTGILTARAYLHNTSSVPVHGPFFVRMLSIHSELGAIAARNSTGGSTGEGAFWNFTPVVKGNSLGPDEHSQPMTLLFNLSNHSLAGLLDGPNAGRGYPGVGLQWANGANIRLMHMTVDVLAGGETR